MEQETMNVGRRELIALAGLLGAAAGCAYLGWLLFWHWPGNAAFLADYDSLASPVFQCFSAYVLLVVALQNWWRRNEPAEDERDRAIDGDAAKHGFVALGALCMVGGIVVHSKPELLVQSGAEWVRFCLLWMVLASMLVYTGYQLYRYRRG
jgi:hypothetical protein